MNKSIMFLALAVSLPVMADDAGVLREKLDAIAGLKADFQQQVTDINGKLIQQGSGELAWRSRISFTGICSSRMNL